MFLQSFNTDADPIFIDLKQAIAHWVLPKGVKLSDVSTLTHVTDDGKVYYEDLQTNAVTWALVVDDDNITAEAVDLASQLLNMTREEVEEHIGQPFPADASGELMDRLQQFCDDPQAYAENFPEDDTEQDAVDMMRELNDVTIGDHDDPTTEEIPDGSNDCSFCLFTPFYSSSSSVVDLHRP